MSACSWGLTLVMMGVYNTLKPVESMHYNLTSEFRIWGLAGLPYLEGHGDLVGRIITPISHIITPPIPICNLLAKSPWPSK